MPIENFDAQKFAQGLAQQAVQLVPQEFEQPQKEYVVNKVYQFCMLAGNALNQDVSISLNSDQACSICQFIGEWTFHKSIDMIGAGLSSELWDTILQQVAFAIFEAAKYTQVNKFEHNQAAATVENEAKASYERTLQELAKAGKINSADIPKILSFSNMENMAEENARRNQQNPQNPQPQNQPQKANIDNEKSMKYASIALFIKTLPEAKVKRIFGILGNEEIQEITAYLDMPDLEDKIDPSVASKYLKEFREIFCKKEQSLPEDFCSKILNLKMNYNEIDIRNAVKFERPVIKNYVGLCLDNDRRKLEKLNLSPYVASVVYDYITSKLTPEY